ncbi:peptide/nickel transport system permease protein [Microbacterium sp. cf046]|uniref:dipeptide/oligopeptide/nickel ABC transporter permease/ATP-binding protein n=1 Tax=Microbacterium sp. cf046 TaxID=1761803 RepID=UPI0008E8B23B|nr:dipeptide/oligopeptide/nickel ABC transporter permease/ATP-binding protein [Microbacterium sp. cf046]SFS13049.1 peptide/nickel transport system permease protein [Microbacterium sp. cf046]
MTVSTTSILTIRRSEKRRGNRLLRSPIAVISLIWIIGLVIASLTSPLWLRYGPLEQDLTAVLQGPSAAHLLGTDELGRDLLSRIVTAAASTLAIATIPPIVAVAITVPVTLWAVRSLRAEGVMNRVSEIVMSLPGTVIILAFIAAVGTNMPLVMALFGVLLFGALYRILFGQAKNLQKQLYVEAAAVDGVRPTVASFRHVLPNMSTTVIVQFVLFFGVGIMMQAGLAFIGLGPQPPEPTWGGMIQTASRFIFQQPWMMVPTGAVLALTIIAANSLADVLSGGAATPPPLVALRRKRAKKSTTDAEYVVALAPASGGASLPREATALFPVETTADFDEVIARIPSDTPDTSAPDLTPHGGPAADGELIVEDLVLGVDGGPALVTGVSLRVPPGRVMGLVGESGCGKSVTSYAILGLLSPGLSVRSGRIQWGATDLAQADEQTLSKVRGHDIAFISQEPSRALDPMFTIGWQLAATVKRLRGVGSGEAKRIAAQLLVDVGIVDAPRVLKSYPHQISGGMAQRVAIALALSGSPRLLVADEPTTALDVTIQAEILGLLRGLIADRGMSIILVTHDLGVVADLCDDVSVMYAGQIVETGSVRDVLVRPEHPYTMALLAADPHAIIDFEGTTRLASIPGQVPLPGSWTTGCRFAQRCRFAQDECLTAIPLAPRAEGVGGVRCIRRDEVRGRQEEWRQPVTIGGVDL